jgi:hypothetical protein
VSTYLIDCSGSANSVSFNSMGEAIKAACAMIASGLMVSRIRGSEGFVMERRDIEMECSRRSKSVDHSKSMA